MNFEKPPIYFDIETGPLPRAEVEKFIPKFEAPSNYKDADKIAEVVSKKEESWFKKAALSCTTGKVLAIGFCSNKDDVSILDGDEITILTSFWNAITYHGAFLQKLVGFNSNEFDIPFLVRRSWKLGVKVPETLFRLYHGRVYLNENCIDLLDYWSFGTRDSIKLSDLAVYLNVGEKTDSGENFAQTYVSDRDSALSYLKNDVLLTYRCSQKLQLFK